MDTEYLKSFFGESSIAEHLASLPQPELQNSTPSLELAPTGKIKITDLLFYGGLILAVGALGYYFYDREEKNKMNENK